MKDKEQTFEIEHIYAHYESLRVKFKGSDQYFFMSPDMLKGHKIKGIIVDKRTRSWFERLKDVENEC